MLALGVVFIVSFAVIGGGIVLSRPGEFRGWLPQLAVLAMFVSGLTLAVNAV